MDSMRILLVQARSPATYWSYRYSLPYAAKEATLPPLGLVTLAALLPPRWDLRLVDLNVEPLGDAELRWADAVLVSGMLCMSDSMQEVLRRARALGKPTVAGGPGPTTSPESFPEADHLFQGEAEGRVDLLVRALEEPGWAAPRVLSPSGPDKVDMRKAPLPRFELLDLDRYASLAIQVSRGCPFNCEFCDIIEVFGRVPRLKSPEQVLAEMDALRRLGGRGPLFFVDDNFIGNRREVAKMLPHIAAWQREHDRPFDLYTEASLDLAGEAELMKAMAGAGFSAVFVGIESPSPESLTEAGKKQNLRMPPAEAVKLLTQAGFEVFAGFIVGFDADGPDIFDLQLDLISHLPIPRAMVGLLSALPGTQLWRRLEREGRLRSVPSGDQFERPNFATAMDERVLLQGYRRLLGALYSPEAYYRRCALYLEQAHPTPSPLRSGSFAALGRAVWGIGIAGPRRRHFWRLLVRSLGLGRAAFARAVTLAVLGEHLIRYTDEVVLPRLDEALDRMTPEPERIGLAAAPAPRPHAAALPGTAAAAGA
jgi:radical SAM superfamily enzyme YgiQ (UPF0313 family)